MLRRGIRLVPFFVLLGIVPALALAELPAVDPKAAVKPGDNLVLEHVPPIPVALAERTARYGESRPAELLDWHPTRRETLIRTRFADTAQVHAVAFPGGARRQLTFFPDRVSNAVYLPDGNSLLLQKDVGGGEWFQLYRYDLATGEATLLTDGRSRNGPYVLARHGTRVAFASTRRNNQDTDIWLLDAAAKDNSSARMLLQLEGGGWAPVAWSHDGRQLLVLQGISINESYLWLADTVTGEKRLLTPHPVPGTETVSYQDGDFAGDDRSVYVLTDRDSEFLRLARIPLDGKPIEFIAVPTHWDIDQLSVSEDGRTVALAANEDGFSRLYLYDTGTRKIRPLEGIPSGVVHRLKFRRDNRDLGFVLNSARSPSDVYSIDTTTGKIERWTQSETGGIDASRFSEPALVRWRSFDGLELSGFLYLPDASRFPGRRPVAIAIHGGPESQFRPDFLGQSNYLLDELGVAVLAPNVRGSSGYGKTFLKLDNGYKREDTYKDINALIDWIHAQPQLDSERILVVGGSYGGHMAWAISAFYSDRIRCAIPIVGMSSLVTFLENTEAYRRDLRRVEYGDERDPAMRAFLEKIAPMNHVESMRKPVFAVAGRNDPRVPWSESHQILDRMTAQGTPNWFLMANDEGHGFAKKKNRDFLFNAEVLFIQQYLLDTPAAKN